MSTKPNEEQIEAMQAETDRNRAERRLTMEPDELVRLDAIESAIKLLTEAGVPFELAASSNTLQSPSFDKSGLHVWYFNKRDYNPDFDERYKNEYKALTIMTHGRLKVISSTIPDVQLIIGNKSGKPEGVYSDGVYVTIPQELPPMPDSIL